MTDVPVKQFETFAYSPSPAKDSPEFLKDVDLSNILRSDKLELDGISRLTALRVLNDLVNTLLEPSNDAVQLSETSSANINLPSPFSEPDTVDDSDIKSCPLSPRNSRPGTTQDYDMSQVLETPTDVISGGSDDQKATRNPVQNDILAKRFSLRAYPGLTLTQYLERIDKYCNLSAAVYLAASLYIYKITKVMKVLTLTKLNAHRVLIAAIRISCKTVEDINHKQAFIAKIGGINTKDLLLLEISLLFLLQFDCQVTSMTLISFLQSLKGSIL